MHQRAGVKLVILSDDSEGPFWLGVICGTFPRWRAPGISIKGSHHQALGSSDRRALEDTGGPFSLSRIGGSCAGRKCSALSMPDHYNKDLGSSDRRALEDTGGPF